MSRYDVSDKSTGSEEDPVVLDDVSVDDFKSFFQVSGVHGQPYIVRNLISPIMTYL